MSSRSTLALLFTSNDDSSIGPRHWGATKKFSNTCWVINFRVIFTILLSIVMPYFLLLNLSLPLFLFQVPCILPLDPLLLRLFISTSLVSFSYSCLPALLLPASHPVLVALVVQTDPATSGILCALLTCQVGHIALAQVQISGSIPWAGQNKRHTTQNPKCPQSQGRVVYTYNVTASLCISSRSIILVEFITGYEQWHSWADLTGPGPSISWPSHISTSLYRRRVLCVVLVVCVMSTVVCNDCAGST